jgi:hypothetical protein
MSEALIAALSAKFPDGLPPWVDPFIKAVKRMEVLETREKNRTEVTTESKEKLKTGKPKKKKKTSRKGKEKVESEPEEGLGDDVEDEVMFQCAEELLKTVRRGGVRMTALVARC